MKKIRIIQVIENSDRYHATLDGVPAATFLNYTIEKGGPEKSLMEAEVYAYKMAIRCFAGGDNVRILRMEKK